MPENWIWTRQLLTCRCAGRDVAALDAKYTKELADAKAENDALRDDKLLLVVVGCTSKQSVSQCVKPPRLRVDNAASPDWQTPLNGIISPSERGWITMQKQLEGTQKYINERRYEPLNIPGNSCNYCEQYTALPAEYNA